MESGYNIIGSKYMEYVGSVCVDVYIYILLYSNIYIYIHIHVYTLRLHVFPRENLFEVHYLHGFGAFWSG